MNEPVRSWRFLDADAGDGPRGGLAVGHTGGVALVEGDAAIRQAVWLLLSTAAGERVMRPDYGCELRRLVFSPADDTTAGLAIHYVRQALARWEPRVEVLRVDAARSAEEPARLDVVLDYRVRATQAVERLELPLRLQEGAP